MSVEFQQIKRSSHLAEWSEMVRKCKSSGMTVRAWCREHGLNEKTYYHRQKQVCNAIPANCAAVPVQFAEVGQPETAPQKSGAAIQIHIGNAKIDVSSGADLFLLRDVIRIVSGIC